MLTFATVSEVAELIPGGDFAVHDGAGHAPMIEDPDGFLELVGPWLDAHG
jgi:pimeloyl-ACP methyl ester carboxylesterase